MTAKQIRDILDKRKREGRPIQRWFIAEQCEISETLLSRLINSRVKDKATLQYVSDFLEQELIKNV